MALTGVSADEARVLYHNMQATENKFQRRIQEYGRTKFDNQIKTLSASLNPSTSAREVETLGHGAIGLGSSTLPGTSMVHHSRMQSSGGRQLFKGKGGSLLPGENKKSKINALIDEYKYGQNRLRRQGTGFNNVSSM